MLSSSSKPNGCKQCKRKDLSFSGIFEKNAIGVQWYCSQCILWKEILVYWPLDKAIHVGRILAHDSKKIGNVYVEHPGNDPEWIQTLLPLPLFLPELNEGGDQPEPHKPPELPPSTKRTRIKRWTPEEDANLLALITKQGGVPSKWSSIAKEMPSRSTQQCRARYTLSLDPTLKKGDWNPLEDATIFQLYNVGLMKWSDMSPFLPGRTNVSIRCRFDSLVKRGIKEDDNIQKMIRTATSHDTVHIDRLRTFPKCLQGQCFSLWDMTKTIAFWASKSIPDASSHKFGPFRKTDTNGEQCARCGLFAPSVQCGDKMCSKTSWCVTCTKLPPHFCGNWLRECMNPCRCQDIATEVIIDPKQVKGSQYEG